MEEPVAEPASGAKDEEAMRVRRRARILKEAHDRGLLTPPKGRSIGFRAPVALIEAAKRSTGIDENTELLTFALASLAVEDDFGRRLLSRKGKVPKGTFTE